MVGENGCYFSGCNWWKDEEKEIGVSVECYKRILITVS